MIKYLFYLFLIITFITSIYSVNLVLNPSFEDNLSNWLIVGNGSGDADFDVSISNTIENRNHSVFIHNKDGGDYGIVQTIILDEFNESPINFSYWVKRNSTSDVPLITLDVRIGYESGDSIFYLNPIKTTSEDHGEWVFKQAIFYPPEPYNDFRAYALLYRGESSAYFDDIKIELLKDNNTKYELENDNTILKFNSYGVINSFETNDNVDLIKKSNTKFSKLNLHDGSSVDVETIIKINPNDDLYNFSYGDNRYVTVLIEAKDTHYYFKIIELNGDFNAVEDIEIFRTIPEINYLKYSDSLDNVDDDEIILTNLPLTSDTVCSSGISVILYCYGASRLDFSNTEFAIFTSKKKNYLDSMENLVDTYNLPKVILSDNQWLKKSVKTKDSYLFATITEDNYQTLANYSQIGNFDVFMPINPVIMGSYSEPSKFDTLDDFKNAMNYIKDKGVKLGYHTFLPLITYNDDYFTDYKNNIYKVKIGKLSNSISDTILTINYDNLTISEEINFLLASYEKYVFLIENELISCESFSISILENCVRAYKSSQSSSHSQNAEIYFLYPEGNYNYFANFDYPQIMDNLHNQFGNLLNDLELDFLYIDGSMYPKTYSTNTETSVLLGHKEGLIPLYDKLDKLPLTSFGGGAPRFSWLYRTKTAAWDGVPYKNKEFTKNYKLKHIKNNNNIYSDHIREFGWWKINGASFINNNYDFDATDRDTIHYVMGKVLAYKAPIGLQLSSYYEDNALLLELISIIGDYHSLIDEIDNNNIVFSNSMIDYLKEDDNEAELYDVNGKLSLVKKKVTKKYLDCNLINCEMDFDNPFSEQNITLEIRPRPDFYDYENNNHILVSDFSDITNANLIESSSEINCEINNGYLEISKTGNTVSTCTINLNGEYNLKGYRGIGIEYTPDANGEVMFVGTKGNQFGFRDYLLKSDIQESNNLLLGDPTILTTFNVQGKDKDKSPRRAWNFNFDSSSNSFYIDINVKSIGTYNINFDNVIALKEKSNIIHVEDIEINGVSKTINISLDYDDNTSYLLNIDRNNSIKIFDSNFNLISSSYNSGISIPLNSGQNNIKFNLKDNYSLSKRMEVTISTFDDSDFDLIATNGSYSNDKITILDRNYFFDDNCPNTFNPNQLDADADGIGDLCDSDFNVGNNDDNNNPSDDSSSSDNDNSNDDSPSISNNGFSIFNENTINCVPRYRANSWSVCLDGNQSRLVIDENKCNVENKTETRKCILNNDEIENKFLNAKKVFLTKSLEKKRTYNTYLEGEYNEIIKTDSKLNENNFILIDDNTGDEYLSKLIDDIDGEYYYILERIDESNINDLKFEGLIETPLIEKANNNLDSILNSTWIIIFSILTLIIIILISSILIIIHIKKIHK